MALSRTSRLVSADQLRRILGTPRLAGAVITVAGGEWHQEGRGKWRLYKCEEREPRPLPDHLRFD